MADKGRGADDNSFESPSQPENDSSLPKEIEYKFLIRRPAEEWFEAQRGHFAKHIEQTYILDGRPGASRIRRSEVDGNVTFFITNKRDIQTGDGGVTRIEIEREINEEEALGYLVLADPAREPIVKTRHVVPMDGHNLEFDVYQTKDDEYAILEIELSSPDEPFTLPSDIEIIDDVTRLPQFRNSALARHFPEGGLAALYEEATGKCLQGTEA